MFMFPTRQPIDRSPVLTQHGLFLLATPAFNLLFRLQGLFPRRKCTGIDQRQGFPKQGISSKSPRLMLVKTVFKIIRMTGVIGPVSAT